MTIRTFSEEPLDVSDVGNGDQALVFLRKDVRRFFQSNHRELSQAGASFGALVVMDGDRVHLAAGDDADDLEAYIKTRWPEHRMAEILKFDSVN